MANSYFQFKQFTIWQDQCAMKVSTDSVLLGTWTAIKETDKEVLDAGAGTGVLSLILAQRSCRLKIVGVEIDAAAAFQASENVAKSPWADRISIVCNNFQTFSVETKFDLIVSNPPYFVNSLKGPNAQRNIARHADEFNYDSLFLQSAKLLQIWGRVSIIIPAEVEHLVIDTAWKYGFYLAHRTLVFTHPHKSYRRLLLSFVQDCNCTCLNDELYIRDSNGDYSAEYKLLTNDFYL